MGRVWLMGIMLGVVLRGISMDFLKMSHLPSKVDDGLALGMFLPHLLGTLLRLSGK